MLKTQRLFIRPAATSDAKLLYDLNIDPEVVRYTGESSFNSTMDALEVIKNKMIPQFNEYKMGRFLVFTHDGHFLGWCGLKFFPKTNEIDLGYRFKKEYWGKGFATESSFELLRYGFHDLGLTKIIAKSMPENTASIKVLQKLGMTFKGFFKDPCEPLPMIVYELKKENFCK